MPLIKDLNQPNLVHTHHQEPNIKDIINQPNLPHTPRQPNIRMGQTREVRAYAPPKGKKRQLINQICRCYTRFEAILTIYMGN